MAEIREENNRKKPAKISLRLIRLAFFVVFIFIVSGVSILVVDNYIFPYLATVKGIGKYKLFQKATDNVVVVNKTEQVTVSEEQNISRYISKSASSVVEIISKGEGENSSSSKQMSGKSLSKVGSGIIVTADGLIVTHKGAIIEGQAKYRIFTGDGSGYDARLIAVDSFTDLALVKIDGVENLSVASFIAPEDVRVGSKIVIAGKNGSNVQDIFKSGLISTLAQDFSISGPIASSDRLQGVYLSDADFQDPGDENLVGGPTVDFNGDVIGILGAEKIGNGTEYFVVPVSYVKSLVDKFISQGDISRGKLGLYYLSLNKELSYLGAESDKGALVFSPSLQQGLAVISGSSAEKAGIKISDIITGVNGEEVNISQNLAYLVSKYKPGEEIGLKIVRDGKEMGTRAILQ